MIEQILVYNVPLFVRHPVQPHRTHAMSLDHCLYAILLQATSQHQPDAAYCYRCLDVAWSVCLCVCRHHEPYKNVRTYRDAIWDVDSSEPKELCSKKRVSRSDMELGHWVIWVIFHVRVTGSSFRTGVTPEFFRFSKKAQDKDIKIYIFVKICPIVIEILTFNK